MLFLPERHIHCFFGSLKQPGLFRSINIFRDHNDLLHLLLTFKQQLQEDSHFADPLLKLVYETALLKERILKRLVVFFCPMILGVHVLSQEQLTSKETEWK